MSASPAGPTLLETAADVRAMQTPYVLLALIGLGGFFNGVTGPLVSAFIPPLVQEVLGDRRTAIGIVMTIDNVLLLLVVPWAGAASVLYEGHDKKKTPYAIGFSVLLVVGAIFVAIH